jgi:diguanylate cyclase (GGDEF)-like protein
MENRIAHLASHDALTGLVNRQEFLQRLQRVVDATGTDGSEHGLCYVDVDRFRVINDRCGHPAGDQLLTELADLLRGQIRRRDTLARVGGNAFAILMEHCSLTQIERVAEAVQRAIGAYRFTRYDQTINVAVTIGVVPIGTHSRSIDQVLKAADHVCYAAKSAGGDRILVYGRPDRSAAKERRGRDTAPAGH